MEVYLKAFINWEQDNWARLLPMAEFTYNNAKNSNTNHILFEFNCNYYPRVFLEENVDSRLKFCFANKLAKNLRELIEICWQHLFHI